MQIVNIAELKNNLSHYLRQAQQGNEITIKDRNRIIARIVPAAPSADYDEELLELAAQGKVKLPEEPPDPNLWRTLKPAKLKTKRKNEIPPDPNIRRTIKPAKLKTKGKAASDLLRRIMDEERGKY